MEKLSLPIGCMRYLYKGGFTEEVFPIGHNI